MMNRSFLLLSLFFGTCVNLVQAQQMQLNYEDAKIEFDFIAEGVKGSIGGFDATVYFDPADLSKSSFEGSVKVETINTGTGMRDKHLQGKGYFNAKKHPKLTFRSNTVEATEDGFKMTGNLAMRGVVNEVTFNFTFEDNTFRGTTTVFTNDYGLMEKKNREDSKVNISIVLPVK